MQTQKKDGRGSGGRGGIFSGIGGRKRGTRSADRVGALNGDSKVGLCAYVMDTLRIFHYLISTLLLIISSLSCATIE